MPSALAVLQPRYRIERELGSGGMATVYLAEDRKHFRMVALKILRPELAASIGLARFQREIEIAAGLDWPWQSARNPCFERLRGDAAYMALMSRMRAAWEAFEV